MIDPKGRYVLCANCKKPMPTAARFLENCAVWCHKCFGLDYYKGKGVTFDTREVESGTSPFYPSS